MSKDVALMIQHIRQVQNDPFKVDLYLSESLTVIVVELK